MVGTGRHFEHFELDISPQRSKEVIALRGDRFGGRLGQRCILLEGFVIGFHGPSFAIAGGDPVVSEVETAGDQIQDTAAAISVYEDLFDQVEREINALQVNGHDRIRFKFQRIDTHILTVLFVLKTQRHFVTGFQGHDEIALQVMFDKHHVVRRRIPDIVEHIAKRYLILHGSAQQLPVDLVFRHARTAFFLARLLVDSIAPFSSPGDSPPAATHPAHGTTR